MVSILIIVFYSRLIPQCLFPSQVVPVRSGNGRTDRCARFSPYIHPPTKIARPHKWNLNSWKQNIISTLGEINNDGSKWGLGGGGGGAGLVEGGTQAILNFAIYMCVCACVRARVRVPTTCGWRLPTPSNGMLEGLSHTQRFQNKNFKKKLTIKIIKWNTNK